MYMIYMYVYLYNMYIFGTTSCVHSVRAALLPLALLTSALQCVYAFWHSRSEMDKKPLSPYEWMLGPSHSFRNHVQRLVPKGVVVFPWPKLLSPWMSWMVFRGVRHLVLFCVRTKFFNNIKRIRKRAKAGAPTSIEHLANIMTRFQQF